MSYDNLTLIEEMMMDNLTIANNNIVTTTDTRSNSLPPHYRYPSGYAPAQIVLASIVATLLMIVVIVGNMLVIIAITTEKSLKNIQNWFIASLAVADFFLGLVIMPFSLANELMGYWTFGPWWCDVHSAMDVLLSTASIMNLCLISLDRYWSITQAVAYLKKRTPRRAALWIGAVWAAAALVCIPPLLGWKVERREAEQYPQCQLSEEVGYVLYSALGSFYIPSCIMVFVYIRIYYAAKARARRGIRKTPRRPAGAADTSFTSLQTKNGGNNNPVVRVDSAEQRQIATIEVAAPSAPAAIPTVTCDLASDISTSDHAHDQLIEGQQVLTKDTLKVVNGEPQQQQQQQAAVFSPRARQPSIMESDMVSEFEPSSSDSGVVAPQCASAAVKPSRLRMCHFGRKRAKKHEPRTAKAVKEEPRPPRDPEREKRRVARKKEKRATLILGLIMGSFIACWLPFFFMYILRLAFTIPPFAFSTAFWLGYMNSALNPVIYTIFNKDFRRAFRRILFK